MSIFWNKRSENEGDKSSSVASKVLLIDRQRALNPEAQYFLLSAALKAQKLRSLEYRFLVFFLHKARHPGSFYLSLLPGLRRYLIFFLEPVFIVPLLPCIFLVNSLKYKTGVLTLQAAMLYGVKIKSGAEPENVMNLCLY